MKLSRLALGMEFGYKKFFSTTGDLKKYIQKWFSKFGYMVIRIPIRLPDHVLFF